MIDKEYLRARVLAGFEAEYQVLAGAARASYEAATHEENRAENKYDTRGLEASYLAESQSARAKELLRTINIYKSLEIRAFDACDPVGMSALVRLEDSTDSKLYFIGPGGGGTKIQCDGNQVIVVSGASPLGRSLLGREVGDLVRIGPPESARQFEITELA